MAGELARARRACSSKTGSLGPSALEATDLSGAALDFWSCAGFGADSASDAVGELDGASAIGVGSTLGTGARATDEGDAWVGVAET